MNEKRKNLILVVLIIFLAIVRLALVSDLPIVVTSSLGQDDVLMVKLANNIVNGEWLGKYTTNTLLKGPIFPIFLAGIYFLHINYISAITIIYIIACLTFIWVMRNKIKNKVVLFLTYLLLLFNPVMLSYDIMQRVYRNSLIPSLSIIIVSLYINLFFKRNESIKSKLLSILGLSIAFPIFWLTREDSIWIMPFIGFMCLSIIVGIIIKNRKDIKELIKKVILNGLILLIPFVSLIILINIISNINEKYYGLHSIYNNYASDLAMNSLNSVKNNVEIEKVTNTREKINRVTGVCPNLQLIMPYFNMKLDGYAVIDGNQDDLEVEDGWFGFALIEAIKASGYGDTPKEMNDFYLGLHNQIESAIANGALERVEEKTDYNKLFKDVLNKSGEVIGYILGYKDITLDITRSEDINENNLETYLNFIKLTNNKAFANSDVYDENGNLVFSLEEKEDLINKLMYKNHIINGIIVSYKVINICLVAVGLLSYVVISIKMIIELFKKKYDLVENWVVTSGVLGAVITLIIGIAYITVTTFHAMYVIYLCATYVLLIVFSVISIYTLYENLIKKTKKEN